MVAFPPQNFAKYRWINVPSDPSLFQRYAAGCELFTDFENRNIGGQHSIQMGLNLSFRTPLSPNHLLYLVRAAWITVRHEVPTVATRTELDAAGDTLLQYRVASGTSEVRSWAERTVQLLQGIAPDDASSQLMDNVIPPSSRDQFRIHIVPVTSVDYVFILSTIHSLCDGAGYKAIAHRFLSNLARYIGEEGLADTETDQLKWGNESDHLLPSYTDVHLESEPKEGLAYDRTLGTILHDFATTLPRMHPYKLRPSPGGPVTSRRIEYKFTREVTIQIIRYAKSKGFTVNQLVHAAIYVSALLDNPSVAEDALLVCMGSINVRDRLRAPFNARFAFPGCCLAGTPVIVPVSVAQGLEGQAQLDAVANVIKQEYARQKAHAALLSSSAQLIDILLAVAKTNPPLPMTGPTYVGDGIGEKDLDHSYHDGAGTEVLQIDSVWGSARQVEPGQNIRAYTWRDQLIISVDFNQNATSREAVEGHVHHIVRLLTVHTRSGVLQARL